MLISIYQSLRMNSSNAYIFIDEPDISVLVQRTLKSEEAV